MPCTYYNSPAEAAAAEAEDSLKRERARSIEWKNELDFTTKMLCDIEKAYVLDFKSPNEPFLLNNVWKVLASKQFRTWAKRHQKMDSERIKAEAKGG